MKKFDIKKLIILVLALLMVFSLVACNPDDGGGDDDPIIIPPKPTNTVQAAEYFQGLWDATKSIGNDAIGEDDAIKIELGLDIALEANGGDPFDIGILLGIVYDPTGAQSAVKAKFYDKATTENWLTLYIFMSEPDMLYISFKDQNIAMPFDTDGNDNASYPDAVNGFINQPLIGELSIADLIGDIAGDFGSNWTLDALLGQVFGLLGVNLGDLLGKIPTSLLGDLTEEELEDLADNPSLLPLLKGLGGTLFPDAIPYVVEDGVTTYTARVGADLMVVLPGLISSYVGNLITADSAIELIYAKNSDGSINSFAIHLRTDDYIGSTPFDLMLTIDSLKIESLGEAEELEDADAQAALGFDVDEFSENSRLDLDLVIGIAGNALVLNPDSDEDGIDLDGFYKLHLEGQLNLNEGDKTQAYASIAYKATAAADYVNLVEVTVSPIGEDGMSQLALAFNSDHPVTQMFMGYVGPSIVKALAGSEDPLASGAGLAIANAAYGTYATAEEVLAETAFEFDTDFEGIVIENFDIDKLVQGLLGELFAGDAEATGAVDYADWAFSISGLLSTAMKAIGYKNGMVSVSVDEKTSSGGGIANLIAGLFAKPANNASVVLFGDTKNTVKGIFGVGGNAVLNDNGTPEPEDDYGWWYTFFAGSAWAVQPASDDNDDKLAAEKATITNLFNSGVEITVNNKPTAANPEKGEISLEVTNGAASINVSLLINVSEATTAYEVDTLRPETLTAGTPVAGWVLLTIPTAA